jgi:hypothetical protein
MNGTSPRAVIFAGPSLPPVHRPTDPRLDWRPPVRQGELYRAALEGPAIIGVVDGYFEVTPTVWHKEILWAMAQGIHVYGSASIGALRATELDSFGMKGIGQIYEAYRDGILEDDDEVAVLHGPEELGYPAVTEAMVNIRATLAAALRQGVVEPSLATSLTKVAKSLFYKKRTYAAILRAVTVQGYERTPLQNLEAWLPAGRVDQKRHDALAMFDGVAAHLAAKTTPLKITYELADTASWQAARRSVPASPASGLF